MLVKTWGILAFLVGAACIGAAVVSALNAPEMSQLLAAADPALDATTWVAHWKLSALILLSLGVACTIAGLGMIFRQRWSFMVLSVSALSVLTIEYLGRAIGYTLYLYEDPEFAETILLFVVSIASLVGYWRWRIDPIDQSKRHT